MRSSWKAARYSDTGSQIIPLHSGLILIAWNNGAFQIYNPKTLEYSHRYFIKLHKMENTRQPKLVHCSGYKYGNTHSLALDLENNVYYILRHNIADSFSKNSKRPIDTLNSWQLAPRQPISGHVHVNSNAASIGFIKAEIINGRYCMKQIDASGVNIIFNPGISPKSVHEPSINAAGFLTPILNTKCYLFVAPNTFSRGGFRLKIHTFHTKFGWISKQDKGAIGAHVATAGVDVTRLIDYGMTYERISYKSCPKPRLVMVVPQKSNNKFLCTRYVSPPETIDGMAHNGLSVNILPNGDIKYIGRITNLGLCGETGLLKGVPTQIRGQQPYYYDRDLARIKDMYARIVKLCKISLYKALLKEKGGVSSEEPLLFKASLLGEALKYMKDIIKSDAAGEKFDIKISYPNDSIVEVEMFNRKTNVKHKIPVKKDIWEQAFVNKHKVSEVCERAPVLKLLRMAAVDKK